MELAKNSSLWVILLKKAHGQQEPKKTLVHVEEASKVNLRIVGLESR
jgi:hypothetical protein